MRMWNYMGLQIDPERLIGKQELLDRLASNGANYRAFAKLRDEQAEAVGQVLAWHFPITEGGGQGAYIIPVRQGFLWIPYDRAPGHDGVLLKPNRARLMDERFCEILESDLRTYSDAMCEALLEMKVVAACLGNGSDGEEMQQQNETAATTVFIVAEFNTADNVIELQPYAYREDAVAHWLRSYKQAEKDGDVFEEVCPGLRFRARHRHDRSNYHECEIHEEEVINDGHRSAQKVPR